MLLFMNFQEEAADIFGITSSGYMYEYEVKTIG
jgi:hypothetical protein